MLKKCLGVLLVVCMLFTMTQPIMVVAADEGTLVVGNGSVTAGDADTVVPITIEKKGDVGASVLQFDVVFPDELILTDKPVVGSLFADKGLHQNIFTSPYTISLGNDTATENVTAEGVLVTLNFKVKADAAAGDYAITINAQDNYNADVDSVTFGVTPGKITVEGSTPPPTQTYTVTFDSKGGSAVAAIENVASGATITEPTAPTRDGFTFTGWFTDSAATANKFDFATKITANTTLYAGWKEDQTPPPAGSSSLVVGKGSVTAGDADTVVPITIEKRGNVGASVLQFDVVFPPELILTAKPTVGTLFADKGLHQDVFTSPYTISLGNDTATENVTAEGVLVTLNFKVKADAAAGDYAITIDAQDNYNADVDSVTFGVTPGKITVVGTPPPTQTYTVTFDSKGGSAVAAIENVASGATITEPAAPTKEGFKFTGWFTDSAATANKFDFATKITADITLYAGWEEDKQVDTYKVTFDSKGGSAVAAIENVASGATITEPAAPTRDGYTFTGWFTDSAATANKFDFATKITADITLYAGWIQTPPPVQTYKVTFDSKGGSAVAAIENVASGATITEPAAPTRDGYTFTGWFTDSAATANKFDFATKITDNITLYAGWTPDTGDSGDSNTGGGNGGGCYIATSVYGSYDTPEVWTLRRFRDDVLGQTWYGRLFIKAYYATSPTLVRLFGDAEWFQDFWRGQLDNLVQSLQDDGFESTPYQDKDW